MLGLLAALLAVTGCSSSDDTASDPPATSASTTTLAPTVTSALATSSSPAANGTTSPSSTAPAGPTSPPPTSGPATTAQPETDSFIGTIVRFTSGETAVDVTITDDTRATRDFLSMLPLTLSFEEFNGREKISYLPRELDVGDTPGSDPEDGDLIYFVPWGNLGFYYNTSGIGYSDAVLRIGAYDASVEQLEQLESDEVTVDIVN